MSAIVLDGKLVVHYEALGRGRPVVFLHGWAGSWCYWMNAMQVASTSFRAYALDLFGFGDTQKDPLQYPIEKQADLISRFLQEMGIGKVALVGHDLGALVAFHFIKQWPKSVDRVMAINCPLEYDDLNPRMKSATAKDLVDWLSSGTSDALSALSDFSKVEQKAIDATMASFQANHIFSDVRNLGVPSLFVYGSSNPAFTIPLPENAESLPLHMHQVHLDGAGHFPMVDNANQFNRLLTDFLALDSGASPRELQMKEEWKRRVR